MPEFKNNNFDHQLKWGISNSLNVMILHTAKIIATGGSSRGQNFNEFATNTKKSQKFITVYTFENNTLNLFHTSENAQTINIVTLCINHKKTKIVKITK